MQDREKLEKMSRSDKEKYKANIAQLGQCVKESGRTVTEIKAVSECASSPAREWKCACSHTCRFSVPAVVVKRAQSRAMLCAVAGNRGPAVTNQQQPGNSPNSGNLSKVLFKLHEVSARGQSGILR